MRGHEPYNPPALEFFVVALNRAGFWTNGQPDDEDEQLYRHLISIYQALLDAWLSFETIGPVDASDYIRAARKGMFEEGIILSEEHDRLDSENYESLRFLGEKLWAFVKAGKAAMNNSEQA